MKKSIISSIQVLAESLKMSKLEDLADYQSEIGVLNNYLGLSTFQTAIFSVVFTRNCEEETTSIKDLAAHFNLPLMEFLTYKDDFDYLIEKGYIIKASRSLFARNIQDSDYAVPVCVNNSILNSSSLVLAEPKKMRFDQYEFSDAIFELIGPGRRADSIPLSIIVDLERDYSELELVRTIKGLCPNIADRISFYSVCAAVTHNMGENFKLEQILLYFQLSSKQIVNFLSTLKFGTTPLTTNDLIHHWVDGWDNHMFELSEKGERLFFQEDYNEKKHCAKTSHDFVGFVFRMIEERQNKKHSTEWLLSKLDQCEKSNAKNEFVQKTIKQIPKQADRAMYYYACSTVTGGRLSMEDIVKTVFESAEDIIINLGQFKANIHTLQEQDILRFENNIFFGNTDAHLASVGYKLFVGEESVKLKLTSKECILPEKIKEKKLYFSEECSRQLNEFQSSLGIENFKLLQERLSQRALPIGVAAIFFGEPGTGKTESVYQIAKATGRAIVQVDVAKLKSCWYGDSEKALRKEFKNYKDLCKKSGDVPILLFNEADAIFGRRKENVGHSADQTDNAIQNIILEEMESLNGILIATTNLEQNLDAAFERRFLFKIKFTKPDLNSKIAIWKDKISSLSEQEAEELASQYDFSGGEIDNIARKLTMSYVINGTSPQMTTIKEYCSHEHLNRNNRVKIGY